MTKLIVWHSDARTWCVYFKWRDTWSFIFWDILESRSFSQIGQVRSAPLYQAQFLQALYRLYLENLQTSETALKKIFLYRGNLCFLNAAGEGLPEVTLSSSTLTCPSSPPAGFPATHWQDQRGQRAGRVAAVKGRHGRIKLWHSLHQIKIKCCYLKIPSCQV